MGAIFSRGTKQTLGTAEADSAGAMRRPRLADVFSPTEVTAFNELVKGVQREGLVVFDPSGAVVYFNPRAAELLRRPTDVLLGASPYTVAWDVTTADGEFFPPDQHPAILAMTTGESVCDVLMGLRLGDESYGWLSLDAYPLELASGRHGLLLFTDVTAEIVGVRELRAIHNELQEQLIQREFPTDDRVLFTSRYRATGWSQSIGGDFLGAYRHSADRIGCFIGDVCGHGIPAAGLSSTARNIVRAVAPLVDDPDAILSRLHDVVQAERPDMFVTAISSILDLSADGSAHVRIACGGHPLPLLVRDGEVSTIGTTGALIGMVDNRARPVADVELRSGDRVIFYTDGVLDVATPRRSLDDVIAEIPAHSHLDDLADWMMSLGSPESSTSSDPADDAAVLGFEIR